MDMYEWRTNFLLQNVVRVTVLAMQRTSNAATLYNVLSSHHFKNENSIKPCINKRGREK